MRDIDVRLKLYEKIKMDYSNDPDTIVIDELGICQGESRIDIAVINGSLNGYEIKSESDNLQRLPLQIEFYGKVFDKITLATSKSHLLKAMDIIPSWWGVESVEGVKYKGLQMTTIREPEINENVDPLAVVQLLWKDEVISIIKSISPSVKTSSRTRMELWNILVNIVPKKELCFMVREKLKTSKFRQDWRSDSLQRLDDDSFQPFSIS